MTVKPIVHEIRIQNQVIFLDPPIEYARATWIKQLHDWLGKHTHQLWSASYFQLDSRCRMSAASHPKFAIRDWTTDARRFSSRDDVHLTGESAFNTL